jgi:MFS family permease
MENFILSINMNKGFAWMSDAMEMMILSILSPALLCEWMLTGWQKALITTVSFIGMGISGSIWGKFSDLYGRKKVSNFSYLIL